jgi:hypothetical protein
MTTKGGCMMLLYTDTAGLQGNYIPWGGAIPLWDAIIKSGLMDKLELLLDDAFYEGMTASELNDLLWSRPETVYEWLANDDRCSEAPKSDGKDCAAMRLYVDGLKGNYMPWGDAVPIWNAIERHGMIDKLEDFLDYMFPDGMTQTELNDFLGLAPELVCKWLISNLPPSNVVWLKPLNIIF